MVSQPSAPPNQLPSYADRAKKAQGNRSKVTVPRPAATSTIGTRTSSVVGSSTVSSAPNASEKPTSAPEVAGIPSGQPSPHNIHANINGDNKSLTADSHPLDPQHEVTATPAPAVKSAPLVNVWQVRKAQMAQNFTRSNQPPSTSSVQKPSTSPTDAPPHTTRISTTEGSSVPSTSSTTLQDMVKAPHAAAGSAIANGRSNADHGDEDEDAFVVRPRAQVSLTSTDEESWPEVGKTASGGIVEVDDGETASRGHDREISKESSQGQGTSRKSEKTKWVPIPAAELQAAVDAQQARSQHGRNRSHHHSHVRARHGQPGTGSGSTSASQSQSRTHSSMRRSAAGSRAGSVSHSQVQSRAGSAQSSPPVASAHGDKRLPGEGAEASRNTSRSISMRSSRTSSPHVSGPAPLPPEFVPASAIAYRSPSDGMRRGSSTMSPQDVGAMASYYAPGVVPPYVGALRSYHSPHSSGSPAQPPYQLPTLAPVPTMYPPHGTQMPVNPPYAGTPPYPVYPPYNYYPPYMYWQPAPVSRSPGAPEGIPPPYMYTRPPVSGEGEGAPGYLDSGFVLPPPATYARPVDESVITENGARGPGRGRRTRELSFGTIGPVGVNGSESPPVKSAIPETGVLGLSVEGQVPEGSTASESTQEPSMPPLAIGGIPGESDRARIRSRTRTQSKGRTLTIGDGAVSISRSISGHTEVSSPTKDTGAGPHREAGIEEIAAGIKTVDWNETKWEFGTTQHPEAEIVDEMNTGPFAHDTSAGETALDLPSTQPPSQEAPPAHIMSYNSPSQLPPIMTTTNGLGSAHSPSYPPTSALPPLTTASEGASSDDWKVKDYGYGFGRKSHAPPVDMRPPEREYYGRPRRGSIGGNYAYDRGGHERGYGRRGRSGSGAPGGRGYHSRTGSRGGGPYQPEPLRQQPPFVVQPQLQPIQTDLNGYYVPSQPPSMTTYYAQPYETYGPPYAAYTPPPQTAPPSGVASIHPLPMPLSPISFPLDPTRYYLLGQLEYYLSPQNMDKDFFLRQRMDSRGWIHIPLLASFKRVTQLTIDLQLVRDVLTLSSLVEVKDDYVRMHQWEQFVLPNAAASPLEAGLETHLTPAQQPSAELTTHSENCLTAEGDEGEAEDDEEEDVVFVLEKET